ncbi:MAG: M23 family metallopeptidase [Chloroflexota bacterium]|nr:M23 family metallopeptidase [Chloroflexota bacterium]
MSDQVLRLEARPAQVFVGVYDRLPHPGLGDMQEFSLDIGITATRAVVLTDVVWRVFDHDDHVAFVRQRLGEAAMEELTRGQYGVAPGLGLALPRCYFLEQGLLPFARVRISVGGFEFDTRAAATASLDVPLVYHEQQATLTLPFESGAWWAITGNDWTAIHKAEPVSWPFAYDFVRLGPDGKIYDRDGLHNEHHYSFGQPVVAPASGKVVAIRAEMADQPPGQPLGSAELAEDPTRMAGNYVVIAHGKGEFSYLAHLQSDSVLVRQDESVTRGQTIASVGNTGQSPGPHLHYHLQNGPNLFVDQGLPIRFSRFEAAGDQVDNATIPPRMIVSPG